MSPCHTSTNNDSNIFANKNARVQKRCTNIIRIPTEVETVRLGAANLMNFPVAHPPYGVHDTGEQHQKS